ncbi:hypothetical protein CRENBAI_001092 [Crenichthys baileyi]|uniref:Uncharacterized protein n=1 Tax=Crenichthys baileyi TaxID=28760 RepID=A0AAV9QRL3_9TELE
MKSFHNVLLPSSSLRFGPTQTQNVTLGSSQQDQADKVIELKQWVKQQKETLRAMYGEELTPPDDVALHSTPAAAAPAELYLPTAASPELFTPTAAPTELSTPTAALIEPPMSATDSAEFPAGFGSRPGRRSRRRAVVIGGVRTSPSTPLRRVRMPWSPRGCLPRSWWAVAQRPLQTWLLFTPYYRQSFSGRGGLMLQRHFQLKVLSLPFLRPCMQPSFRSSSMQLQEPQTQVPEFPEGYKDGPPQAQVPEFPEGSEDGPPQTQVPECWEGFNGEPSLILVPEFWEGFNGEPPLVLVPEFREGFNGEPPLILVPEFREGLNGEPSLTLVPVFREGFNGEPPLTLVPVFREGFNVEPPLTLVPEFREGFNVEPPLILVPEFREGFGDEPPLLTVAEGFGVEPPLILAPGPD